MDSERNVSRSRPQRRRQHYHPKECPAAPIEAVELAEVIGHVLPADLIAALAGKRGAPLHITGSAS